MEGVWQARGAARGRGADGGLPSAGGTHSPARGKGTGAGAARSAEVGAEMADDVRWIRTYVVQEADGTLGTVCIYQGTSPEKVREQAERTGMPADEIVQVIDTVVVNPDPVAAEANA